MSQPIDADGVPSTLSYAEATKEDPKNVEERHEAREKDGIIGNGNGASSTPEPLRNGTNATESVKQAALATSQDANENDILSYADAVKEDPADVKKPHIPVSATSAAKTADGSASHGNSTAVNSPSQKSVTFPDIPDDAAVEIEHKRERAAATDIGGIRFAPLRLPFPRRLQTFVVLMHGLSIGTSLSAFFFLCAIPLFWPLIIVYLIIILVSTDATDGRSRKRKEWVRRSPIWHYFVDYFPARLHKTHDLVPTRKYIFGYHPHGIISNGAWAAFATEALGFAEKFPGITNSVLTLDSNFRLPIYREYVFAMGALSVSKESIINILTRGGPNGEGMGRAVTIVVGGARESLEAEPNTLRLIINERKGFIKVAVQTGADLVPVLAFGENDLFDQLKPKEHPYFAGVQKFFLKVMKFTVPLLHGRGIFNYDVGLMPYRRPMNVVVGKPIRVAQADNPDPQEVDRLHGLYVEELRAIWDRYKDEFASHRKGEMEFLD